MELTTLRQFIAIADARHLTRAAAALGLTQPALSAMLRKLEHELGAELLHRTGRGVEPTEAGRVFLEHAREVVRRAEGAVEAVKQLTGLERGTIRVGGGATAITYLLPPVVGAVRDAHPGLRFYIREGGSTAIAQAVLAGELDLGIVTLPIAIPESDRLLRIPLVEDELRLIVPRGAARQAAADAGAVRTPARAARRRAVHPLPGPTFRWKELAGEPVVGFEAGSAVREVIDRAAAEAGVTLDYVMELRSIESIKRMVQAGIGVGFVSRFALGEGEGLTCAQGRLTRRLAIVRRRDRDPSAAARACEQYLLHAGRGMHALLRRA